MPSRRQKPASLRVTNPHAAGIDIHLAEHWVAVRGTAEVTVGEKIGKAHLSYGQGASAELVAMGTIAAADWFGLPVSTTHVLSSGIAGTMAANRSGLQMDTLRNLCLAWVLTLPACVLLGATLFAAGFYVFLNVVGLR